MIKKRRKIAYLHITSALDECSIFNFLAELELELLVTDLDDFDGDVIVTVDFCLDFFIVLYFKARGYNL